MGAGNLGQRHLRALGIFRRAAIWAPAVLNRRPLRLLDSSLEHFQCWPLASDCPVGRTPPGKLSDRQQSRGTGNSTVLTLEFLKSGTQLVSTRLVITRSPGVITRAAVYRA